MKYIALLSAALFVCLSCRITAVHSHQWEQEWIIENVGYHEFRERVNQALVVANRILLEEKIGSHRRIKDGDEHDSSNDDDNVVTPPIIMPDLDLMDQVDHRWTDKYDLAESLTNIALAAQFDAFLRLLALRNESTAKSTNEETEAAADSDSIIDTLLNWVHGNATMAGRNLILRFNAQETCTLLREDEVVTYSDEYERETVIDLDGATNKKRNKKETARIANRHTEYHWNFEMRYDLLACPGMCPNEDSLQLIHRNRSITLITRQAQSPFPSKKIHNPLDVDFGWFLQSTATTSRAGAFRIDRSHSLCKTPVRNPDIEKALDLWQQLQTWITNVDDFFFTRSNYVHMNKSAPNYDSPAGATKSIFVPVLPILQNRSTMNAHSAQSLLYQHGRTMDEALDRIRRRHPSPQSEDVLLTSDEAVLRALLYHMGSLIRTHRVGIYYIETNLRRLLSAATGKILGPRDFDHFMNFYNQKLFHPDYAPQPFSHAIRVPGRYPDGILSIEAYNSEDQEPIQTLVRREGGNPNTPIRIPLSAATSVEMTGDRFVHGWMLHRFDYGDGRQWALAARARQFSSFLLMVGTMKGPDVFDAKHAIIVQNKDEVLIPLLTEVLPSAKEFKDAVASLSPEQQAFARAYRAMQLESSIFAICVVQLKPQLEIVLNLPEGSLTKEIQLTQDLMSLFVEYQIPTDLVSFDGNAIDSTAVSERISAVKGHVKAVLSVIDGLKAEQVTREKERADLIREKRKAASVLHSDSGVAFELPTAAPHAGSSSARMRSFVATTSDMAGATIQSRSVTLDSIEPQIDQAESAQHESVHESAPTDKSDASMTFEAGDDATAAQGIDVTLLPKLLDAKLETYDKDGALRSTIIKAESNWIRRRHENLIESARVQHLSPTDIDQEKKRAVDLLDALSRSGALPLQAAELHVVVGVTHSFDKSVVNTLVEDNVNPIERVERSLFLFGNTIFGGHSAELIRDSAALSRLQNFFPAMFGIDSGSQDDVVPRPIEAATDA